MLVLDEAKPTRSPRDLPRTTPTNAPTSTRAGLSGHGSCRTYVTETCKIAGMTLV